MRKCFVYNPSDRITAQEALKHPFFTNYKERKKSIDNYHNSNTYTQKTKEVISSLVSFTYKSKFFQAVLTYLTHNFMQKQEINDIKDIFLSIDTDLDGKISKSELRECLIKIGMKVSEDELSQIMKRVDFDNDGFSEMVINIHQDYGAYLVLHCVGTDVYGYELGYRALNDIRCDGTFTGSDGADCTYIFRMEFANGSYRLDYEAIMDGIFDRFEIKGKTATREQVNNYFIERDNIPSVEWIDYYDDYIANNYSLSKHNHRDFENNQHAFVFYEDLPTNHLLLTQPHNLLQSPQKHVYSFELYPYSFPQANTEIGMVISPHML
jgi:serine/threonine protein kinase